MGRCTLCERYKDANTPCLEGVGEVNSEVMIIGEAPSWNEDFLINDVFDNPANRWLSQRLDEAGIDVSKCYRTYAVKCYGKKPKVSEIKACKQILLEEIEKVKPKYILVLGDIALKAVCNVTGITKKRGSVIKINVGGNTIKVLPTFNPKIPFKSPVYLPIFLSDLKYFYKIVTEVGQDFSDFKYKYITTNKELKELELLLSKAKTISYDIETTDLDEKQGYLRMIGIGVEVNNMIYSYVIPIEPKDETEVNISHVITLLIKYLGSNSPIKNRIAQNAKFDNHWLRSRGIRPHTTFDTYQASYCLNVTLPHDLKYLAKVYCGAGDYAIDARNIDDYPVEVVAKYCALDCYYTLKLYYALKKELIKDQHLARVFKYIIMPGSRVLENVRERGIYINLDRLKEVKREYEQKAAELENELNKLAGKTINWGSPIQVADVLFNDLGLEPISYTAKGQPQTGKNVLLKLAPKHELPNKLLEYKKYVKALDAFLNPWEKLLEEQVRNGLQPRLYTTYNIAKTATGRLSAQNPNLQQVPRDKNVRNLVSAPPGRVLIEADFSQIELRVAAFIAGSNSMKEIYRNGGDIHTTTGAEVSGLPYDEVKKNKSVRTAAKAVNFGFLYGMWWRSFKEYAFASYGVVLTDEEAQHYRERYFDKYHELPRWHERQKNEVRTYGYVRSPLGRIRHLPNIYSPDKDLRSEAERQAINTPVQSMASDMTLLAMIELEKTLPDTAYIVGQVHDAIMVECNEEDAITVGKHIKQVMESVPNILKKYFGINFDLPVVAEVEIGPWGAGKPLE